MDLQFNSMQDGCCGGAKGGGQNAEQAHQWQGVEDPNLSSVGAGGWSLLAYAPGALSDVTGS